MICEVPVLDPGKPSRMRSQECRAFQHGSPDLSATTCALGGVVAEIVDDATCQSLATIPAGHGCRCSLRRPCELPSPSIFLTEQPYSGLCRGDLAHRPPDCAPISCRLQRPKGRCRGMAPVRELRREAGLREPPHKMGLRR